MSAVRAALLTAVLLVAVVLQMSLFSGLAVKGVVPDLVLLVVVAVALARGPELAMLLGFFGGVLLDLAPPADHTAGRWSLALVLAAYLAGRVRQDAGKSVLASVLTVAATSFVATSVFALSGLVLHEDSVSVGAALAVIPISVVYDVVLTPFVLPPLIRVLRATAPPEIAF